MTKFFLPLGVVSSLLLVSVIWRPGFEPLESVPPLQLDGNRFAYLDDFANPYWVDRDSPKLITPQWIGESGVEAAAVLSIDDMRAIDPYQNFIEPILQQLEATEGTAPLSIFTNTIDPNEPQLQAWLKRGVSIEVHTIDHPCPLLKDGDFHQAKTTVDQCIDLLDGIPNMTPVTYRMPCCDSMNSVSPRFYQEIIRPTTATGRFLTSDSSVFQVFTSEDTELPEELFQGPHGKHRFTKYLPLGKDFVNHISNYPYPYLIGGQSWQFPCTVPSDWEAQYLHGKNHPKTIDDLKATIDATVAKQGLFVFVFHPHGWIENTQVADLIAHAKAKHGSKLRFLSMRDVQERIDTHLLRGQSIRKRDGSLGNSRLVDVNDDGFMDVLIDDGNQLTTHVWLPDTRSWQTHHSASVSIQAAAFGALGRNASMVVNNQLWHFNNEAGWQDTKSDNTWGQGHFRDLDGDGICEWLTDSNLPESWSPVSRCLDLDQDGDLDFVVSDTDRFAVYLYQDNGWQLQREGKRSASSPPSFVDRNGRDNGVWADHKGFIIQNEHTSAEPNVIKRVSFESILAQPSSPEAPLLQSKPLDALTSLKLMRTHEDLHIELVASEPMVMDPIDIAWGADGKLWVVEMADYPTDTEGGRIRYLEDSSGDGQFDKSTVYLKGIPFPTGVMPWKSGALVLSAPNLYYTEDTDNDGEADRLDILYSGFGEGNQQHRANCLRWGLDNWIYIANGDSSGIIKSAKTGKEVNMQGRDLRIRPGEGFIELASGLTQHGRNHDDEGNWYGNDNSNPLWHYVLSEEYMQRNPHVTAPSPLVHLPEVPGNAPVFPTSVTFERFNDFHTANCITSACSSMILRDSRLGNRFIGSAFICEPVHNLVHREVLTPKGVTFTSRRADDEQASEFLTSADPWSRPVACHTGPDGALWVVDMYRQVIEHPEWIPHEWEVQLDLRAGYDRGRIFRITSKATGDIHMPNLTEMTAQTLVDTLSHPSGTVRDLAQQQLLIREPGEIVAPLTIMASTHEDWRARLHALCVLDGLGQVDVNVITKALTDSNAAVRRHAIRIAPSVPNAPPLTPDTDPKTNLQVAFSMTDGVALAQLPTEDPFMRAAVLSSIPSDLDGFINALLEGDMISQRGDILTPVIRTAQGMQRLDLVQAICRRIDNLPLDSQRLAILADALQLDLTESQKEDLTRNIPQTIAKAQASLNDPSRPQDQRAAALTFLANATTIPAGTLHSLIQTNQPIEMQEAAIRELAVAWPERFAQECVQSWPTWEPAIRNVAKEQIHRRADVADQLMKAPSIPEDLQRLLISHPNPAIKGRAAQQFGATTNADPKILEKFAQTNLAAADSSHGRQIFSVNCQICHRINNEGNDVGPDLTALTNPSRDFLLHSIIHPNEAVEDKYLGYAITTKSGDTTLGLMESVSGGSVRLRLANGDTQQIVRSEIANLTSTGMSLMPEGFGESLSPKDMNDLLGYLQTLRSPRKHFDRNEPTLVTPDASHTLHLMATQASVHGPSLTFEIRYLHLGNWCHVQDQAVWQFRCDQPGRYAVALDFACDDDVAGDSFQFTVGKEKVTGTVPGTKNFNGYRQETFGEIHLTKGEHEGVFRSAGPINKFLLDLRQVQLTYLGES